MPIKPNLKSPQYKKLEDRYSLIFDVLEGQERIKEQGVAYLPAFDYPEGNANSLRYRNYKERAVFYPVTKRTREGLVAEVFVREPRIEITGIDENILNDINGKNLSLTQFAKVVFREIISYGNGGIFVDYPQTDGVTTIADLEKGNIRPVLSFYPAYNIVNYETKKIGSKTVLSMVLLYETEYVRKDNSRFEKELVEYYRCLELDENNNYFVTIYEDDGVTIHNEPIYPTDAKGNFIKEIPFFFCGSLNNDIDPDEPPLYDLAEMNIAHYRNSAEYEDLTFKVGQPQLVEIGGNERTENSGSDVFIGSAALLRVPKGGDYKYIQVQSDTLPFEAMKHKEEQMVKIGARLIEGGAVQSTATEVKIDKMSETSIVKSTALNVNECIKKALEFFTVYTGLTVTVEFELNTEFELSFVTPEQIGTIVSMWQQGAITFEEMRKVVKSVGFAHIDDEEAKETIDAEMLVMNEENNNVPNG